MRPEGTARVAGTVAAAAVATAVLAVAWGGLRDPGAAWRPAVLCALAALPALAAVAAPRWRPAIVAAASGAAALGALALVLRIPPWDLIRLDGTAWSGARAILPDGLREAADASLPASAEAAPALVALLDLCLWTMCAVAAWQLIVRRQPVAALVVVAAGLGYRWTVEPPADEVRAGVLALAACVAVLALSGWRGRDAAAGARRAAAPAALCAIAAGVGLLVAASPVAGGDGWLDWRDWRMDRAADAPGALELRQRYAALDRRRPARAVLAVRTERALPLRAAVLDEFDGDAFTIVTARRPDREVILRDGRAQLGYGDDGERVDERIRVLATHTGMLIAPARPVAVAGLPGGRVALLGETVRLGTTLREGDEYAVRSVVPDATAAELSAAESYATSGIPVAATRLRPHMWGAPVDIPAWGTGGAEPDDAALGAFAPVRRLARAIAGDAPTPYAAVARIEAHLRRGYRYDEAPPAPRGDSPALADFLLRTRRGYCQHFAGAMGVMLRSIGIPARVAVGYTPGGYDVDADLWIVDDRDAHSWVEVWFPGYGWLPFDPTPGRSAPTPASVSSPSYDPPDSIPGIRDGADAGLPEPEPARTAEKPQRPETTGTTATTAPDDGDETAQAPAVGGGSGGDGGAGRALLWAALGVLLAFGAVLAALPAARRARARRRGDGRTRVAAAVADLERALAAMGVPVPAAAAPGERARHVSARTGVDAGDFYRRTAEARFGPAEPGAAEVAWAWRESARLRRALRRTRPPRARLRAALAPRGTVES